MQRSVGMTEDEANSSEFYKENGNSYNNIWKLKNAVKLVLWYQYMDDPAYKNLGFSDVLTWRGNELHNRKLKGSPESLYIIISSNVHHIITNKDIQKPFEFHKINIEKEDTLEVRQYYSLQIINSTFDEIDYEKSSFNAYIRNKFIKNIAQG